MAKLSKVVWSDHAARVRIRRLVDSRPSHEGSQTLKRAVSNNGRSKLETKNRNEQEL